MNSLKGTLAIGGFYLLSFALCPSTSGQAVSKIAAGYGHTLFQKSDGSLWGMGWNWAGQLGDGKTNDMLWPERIISSNIGAIAAGTHHSLFLKSDGSLWVMGDNNGYQLGDGTTQSGNFYTNRPEQIVSSNVVAIAGGNQHSLFLISDGSLWAMGANNYGQLGDGTTDSGTYVSKTPEQIVSSNVTAIAAGAYHSLFIKSDGSLWGMGGRSLGELGDGTPPPPYYTNSPEQIISGGVVAITAGYAHSQLLKLDGSLWAMGFNYDGQLSDGTRTDRHSPVPIVPDPPLPVILGWNFSGTDLTLHVTNGLAGGTYYVLTSSSAALPLSQWALTATSAPVANGTFTLMASNAFVPSVSQRFYALQLLR